MGFHRYRGLALVALWQVAPVVVHQDSAGRVQVHFAGGGGRYEEVSTSCDGQVIDTDDFGYAGGGVGLEVWPADFARVNGFAGLVDSEAADFADFSLGALGALEWRHVGVGLGVTVAPGEGQQFVSTPEGGYTVFDPTDIYPIIYLRAGNIDGYHLRFESTSDEGIERMGGVARLGLAYNQGLLRGSSMFSGVALCHAGCDGDDGETAVFFLDLSRPIAPSFDAQVGIVAGAGERNGEFGFTLGGSWLPRATRRTVPPEIAP